MNNKSITVRGLIAALKTANNQEAVVTLCQDGVGYSDFVEFIDNTQQPDANGHIGNFLLKLHPDSDAAQAMDLASRNDDVWDE